MTDHDDMLPLEIRRTAAGDVAIRADAAGDGRTIEGYAYRWGTATDPGATAEYGPAAEAFDRAAFEGAIAARGPRPFPFLARHRGQVVGSFAFATDDVGLAFSGRLLDTSAARDYAAEVASGLDTVSLEFIPGAIRRERGRVIHTAVRRLVGLAGEYAPAYETATVAVRSNQEEAHVTETTETNETTGTELATRATAGPVALSPEAMRALMHDVALEAYRTIAERGGAFGDRRVDPLADLRGYGSLGALYQAAAEPGADAALRSYVARAIAYRALDDTVTTAGANAGLLEGALTTQRIARIVNAGRPAITAFGGPRPITDGTGMNLSWPYFDGTLSDFVGAQSAEKAEITSASMDIKLGTEALVTYAGGTDMSYQLIRRASPSALDAWAAIVLAAWAQVTEAAFVTELETGSVTGDLTEAVTAVDFTELVGHLVTQSVAVEAATGAPAEFMLCSTTAFTQYAKLVLGQTGQLASTPAGSILGLSISLGGVPLIHAPAVTAGKAIISNRQAAAWHEDGPFQASAEDVAKLGRNVAYWSMGAGARYIPAGIIELYDVTP